MTVEPFPNDDPYAGTGLPELGLRNYGYPVLAAWRLGRKPKAVKVLATDIAIFRDRGRLYALAERCPHRGARLSKGKCLCTGSGALRGRSPAPPRSLRSLAAEPQLMRPPTAE